MTTELGDVIARLQSLERLLRTSLRGGVDLEALVNDEVAPFVENTSAHVARIQQRVEQQQVAHTQQQARKQAPPPVVAAAEADCP